ncbi:MULTISPECIES: hypothetical protein [Gordonia]|uniref:Dihydrodipicolinate reductase N-terminal domain-containing protein n=1 Tax=Gordonia rubripertincta TaxID=36822 RepID=A0AAW6RGB0_GORRU|nr:MULTISPECIES: hypothetical protein [Gordonia]ASR04983.1 hypothetical protein GCWB2_21055 [Gordonia rubripertincta]MDG6783663.1 hypothetical protein [Gordonia rubripertincta]MDJ0009443.1 hypothetical protein [Gordonia alkanivorans]MDJ0099654.1 hypothetical protein [Gordonia alkanivorans]MDJ0495099.1 hypothetical protein [Gordonia alkanivorans]
MTQTSPTPTRGTRDSPPCRPYRIAVWGPGEVGGAVIRAALADPAFEVVGALVHNREKDGRDIGELVRTDPIGIGATRDREAFKELDVDCVVLTPAPAPVIEGLDDDVVDLLEAGKNVVATAAYHNVSMPNWLSPFRKSPHRMLEACHAGGATLHGTGVHPTFIVERVAMTMARAMSSVSHVRSVEAVDFSRAGSMWGGLGALGFGAELDSLSAESPVARGGDIYYGDLTGNVAHALYGVDSSEVRVETSLRGIPAERDAQVGATTIRKGTAAALHLTHRGYLGDHHFFTNEECWYLASVPTRPAPGAEAVYRGDDLPFGGFTSPIAYTLVISGEPAEMRTQLEFGVGSGHTNPITTASVRAVLDAIPAVVDAEPGILIDDIGPHYRHDDRVRLP